MTPEEFSKAYGPYISPTDAVKPLPPESVEIITEATYQCSKLAFDFGERGIFIGYPSNLERGIPSRFGASITITFKFTGIARFRHIMQSLRRMKWEGYLFELVYKEDETVGPNELHAPPGCQYVGRDFDDLHRISYVELHGTYYPTKLSVCQEREPVANMFTVAS